MKRFTTLLTSALVALAPVALAGTAVAQTIAITNGKVATIANPEPIDGATVVIQNGRIAAVGRNIAVPAGAQVVDAAGKWVTPGLMAGFSRLGLMDVDAVDESEDASADNSPFSAALDIASAVNPRSVSIPVNRIEGLTRAVVAPSAGHDVFVGQGALIHLGDAGDIVTRPRAFQFVELGERGGALAGGSRPAAFLNFRNGLKEAQDYARNPSGYEGGKDRDALLTRLDAQALVPVVQGRQPVVIHVERAADINRVLELKREFPGLRLILVGAAEGWMVADKLAAAKVPVIATATNNLPTRFEMLGSTQSNVGRMVKAGVKVALGMIDDDDSRQVRLLPQHAGNLVAQNKIPGAVGISHAQALAALTRTPAEIFGVADQLGTLEPGKIADVVVWDGDPIELSSAPTAVFIEGKSIPLVSRQTKLRDRYLGLQKQQQPLHYRR